MEELYKYFEKSMNEAKIYCDGEGCEIKGTREAVLTLLTKIFEGLIKNGISINDINEALKLATMSDREAELEMLKKMKEVLAKFQKELEEE